MSSITDKNCCDGSVPYEAPSMHPDYLIARHSGNLRRSGKRNIFETAKRRDPIGLQTTDSDERLMTFEKYPLIPYRGGEGAGSGDSLLDLLHRMRYLSYTHGACIEAQKTYSFGGDLKFVDIKKDEFKGSISDEVISEADEVSHKAFLDGISLVGVDTWTELAERLFDGYKTDGNLFLRITVSKSLGVYNSSIEPIETPSVRYVRNPKASIQYLAVSESFDADYLLKYPPTFVPVFPNWQKNEVGAFETMLHRKNGRFTYGTPDSFNGVLQFFRQFQDVTYLIREADGRFRGSVMIEVEGANPDASTIDSPEDVSEFGSTAEKLQESFTEHGEDPTPIIYMERPAGSAPSSVHQFAPNTNEGFFSVTDGLSSSAIIQAHQWSRRFLGEQTGGAFSNAEFMEEFKIKLPLINRYQKIVAGIINKALEIIADNTDKFELKYGIMFTSPFRVIDVEMGAGDNKQNVPNEQPTNTL